MNRLIIIGNGFDLANGLHTSYKDFIEWYWDCWWDRLSKSDNTKEEDELCIFKLKDKSGFKSFFELWCSFPTNLYSANAVGHEVIKDIINNRICLFELKSELFSDICKSYELNNWVDIENIFYQLLCSKISPNLSPKKLNDDLNCIRAKLFEYLSKIQIGISKDIIDNNIYSKLYEPFKKQDIAISSMQRWYDMLIQRTKYSKSNWQELIGAYQKQKAFVGISNVEHFLEDKKKKIQELGIENISENEIPEAYCFPDYTMLLNFNYTSTADLYFEPLANNERFVVNHIHGNLSDLNSIVFGYGDEMDEHYKTLVNKNDNDYLTNIKSIKYLEAVNYRRLLSFVDSDYFQIYTMGHSCGNSDRTLLHTLFEHKNCVSIKPFYHKKSNNSDDYMNLVQNISRNFTNMALMRDRVVNKTFCVPLGGN